MVRMMGKETTLADSISSIVVEKNKKQKLTKKVFSAEDDEPQVVQMHAQ